MKLIVTEKSKYVYKKVNISIMKKVKVNVSQKSESKLFVGEVKVFFFSL